MARTRIWRANAVPRGSEDWDFEAEDDSPDDSDDHGTHVCGTAAAVGDNGKGITGVAPECMLMPLRINLQAGMNANRADAINFVSEKAVANSGNRYVINCSWICSGSFAAILAAIDNAVEKGALVVVSAGNAARYGSGRASTSGRASLGNLCRRANVPGRPGLVFEYWLASRRLGAGPGDFVLQA